MTKQMMCTFCRNKGIILPHDHSIRDFTKKGSPIICPQLLTLQCKYCKEKGHTVKYCKILKEKKINKPSPLSIVNTKKHSLITDTNGFSEIKKINVNKFTINTENTVSQNIKKIQKINMLSSMFGALDVDKEVQDISKSREINKTRCWGDSDEEAMFNN
jgi:hypothetical protein